MSSLSQQEVVLNFKFRSVRVSRQEFFVARQELRPLEFRSGASPVFGVRRQSSAL